MVLAMTRRARAGRALLTNGYYSHLKGLQIL